MSSTILTKDTLLTGIICKACNKALPPMTVKQHLEGDFEKECPHVKTYTYRLRSECIGDIQRFQKVMNKIKKEITTVELEHQYLEIGDAKVPIPDMLFTFKSIHHLQEIKHVLKCLPDAHVMEETLATLENYTGERTYGVEK
jgi:hypothetical protein